MTESKDAVADKRLGNIRMAIFENRNNKTGAVWYSIAPSRQFKNSEGATQYAANFSGESDLVLLAELLAWAKAWIQSQHDAPQEE